MKYVFTILIFFTTFTPVVAAEKNLPEIGNAQLVHLLNDFELIAEKKEPPLTIRIIRVRDHGECDGRPSTCPKEVLYLAVSTFDEAPDQKLYKLPKAYGWKFIEWKYFPKQEDPKQFLIFEVEEKVISKNPKITWWEEKKFEIGVNPWKGYIKPIK